MLESNALEAVRHDLTDLADDFRLGSGRRSRGAAQIINPIRKQALRGIARFERNVAQILEHGKALRVGESVVKRIGRLKELAGLGRAGFRARSSGKSRNTKET